VLPRSAQRKRDSDHDTANLEARRVVGKLDEFLRAVGKLDVSAGSACRKSLVVMHDFGCEPCCNPHAAVQAAHLVVYDQKFGAARIIVVHDVRLACKRVDFENSDCNFALHDLARAGVFRCEPCVLRFYLEAVMSQERHKLATAPE
jgi:hypothetical protein